MPCEPDADDYAEIRYFARIASLLVERHIAAETRLQAQQKQRQADDGKEHFLAVLELALETVLPQFRQKQQRVAVTLPPQALYLDADAMRLTQMVTNLLNNACKFTGPQGKIALDVQADATHVAIHVRDNGAGLAPEGRERIFAMFSQQHGGAGARFGGLGIALALVKDLAALHGGSIEAHSDGPGLGSEFVLRLKRG